MVNPESRNCITLSEFKSTPVSAIYLELGVLPIEYEIMKKKLMWRALPSATTRRA